MPTIKIVPFPGVPGPRGETGATGPAGPQGIQGIQGESGVSARQSYSVQGGTISGTQPTFVDLPMFYGSYVQVGDTVHFQIQVDMDNITDFGTGQYYVTLPFNAKYPYQFRDGCLHDISSERTYHISGHVAAGSNELRLFTTDVAGTAVFDFPFSQNEPVNLSVEDNFHIAGTYIIE